MIFVLGLITIEELCYAKEPKVTKEVTIKILDKILGQTVTLKTPVLKPIRYKHLIIRPRTCFKKKVGTVDIKWAFIEAWIQPPRYRSKPNDPLPSLSEPQVELVFSSWINSTISDFSHPEYSIIIEDCKEIAQGSSP